jgi:hypothetical protein
VGGPTKSSRSMSGGKLLVCAFVVIANARNAIDKMVFVNRICKSFSKQRSGIEVQTFLKL